MLRKTLLILSASATLGAAVIASNGALAFGPPPLPGIGGPPPGLGGPPRFPGLGGPPHFGGPGGPAGLSHLGGPGGLSRPGGPGGPAGLSRLGGPGFHAGGHGLQGNVHGLQGHSAAYGHGRSAAYGYGHSARYGYGHVEWRHGRWGRYDVSVEGSDGYGADGYASADGCTYTYSERRHRRVLVCDAN
jgi:hypothetical protein